jgi:hypothetical protein
MLLLGGRLFCVMGYLHVRLGLGLGVSGVRGAYLGGRRNTRGGKRLPLFKLKELLACVDKERVCMNIDVAPSK